MPENGITARPEEPSIDALLARIADLTKEVASKGKALKSAGEFNRACARFDELVAPVQTVVDNGDNNPAALLNKAWHDLRTADEPLQQMKSILEQLTWNQIDSASETDAHVRLCTFYQRIYSPFVCFLKKRYDARATQYRELINALKSRLDGIADVEKTRKHLDADLQEVQFDVEMSLLSTTLQVEATVRRIADRKAPSPAKDESKKKKKKGKETTPERSPAEQRHDDIEVLSNSGVELQQIHNKASNARQQTNNVPYLSECDSGLKAIQDEAAHTLVC